MRHHLRQAGIDRRFKVSSAGTRASQPGARPDQRTVRVAAAAGIDIRRIRARRVTPEQLVRSDFVFALDTLNLVDLQAICPDEHRYKISLLLSHLPEQTLEDVPDPYYGNYRGFEEVFQLIESAARQLVSQNGFFH